MQTKKNILVTGASGTVGSEDLDQLRTHDEYNVTVFDIKTGKSKKKFRKYKDIYNIVFGDITNPADVAKVTSGIDFVIHLAAIIPPLADSNTKLAYNVNVNGTKNLLESLKAIFPLRFIDIGLRRQGRQPDDMHHRPASTERPRLLCGNKDRSRRNGT